MKVVILCGGLGTRIRDVAADVPKPMVEIGDRPILWHIMKSYATQGFMEFVLCLGYKGQIIKDYFLNYQAHASDFTLTLGPGGGVQYHDGHAEAGWTITFAETGLKTMTGGRIGRIKKYIGDKEFMLTYGDAVSDIKLAELLCFHRRHGRAVSVTGVRPPGRFGELTSAKDGRVTGFNEKPQAAGGRISGGYFVCSPKVFDYVDCDETLMFERGPLQQLAQDGQLMVYRHDGFWQCMDTYRDYKLLNDLIEAGKAPWMTW